MKRIIYAIALLVLAYACNDKKRHQTDTKVDQISNYLDSLHGFSGTVLIAKNDNILFEKAYGYAHLGHKIKNKVDTKFSFASIGKSFTAVIIFQLIQEGKLSLQDPVGKYLPNYQNKTVKDSVTIEHLLTHRSGIPNYFQSKKFLNTPKNQFRNIEDLTHLYEKESMEFSPGTSFAYRNTNYILLGRIIEVITNTSYDTYFKKHILELADMKNTGYFDSDHIIENSAENYTLSNVYPNKLQKTVFMSTVKGSPAGGGYTTLNDLYNFATAFKNNKLLNTHYTDVLKKEPKTGWYGYGMQFAGAKKSGIYGHSGGHYGVGAEWRIFDRQNYTVILLTNKDLDQGFMDARFFIEKTISGSTAKLEGYFFTKKIVTTCLDKSIDAAIKMTNASKIKPSEYQINSKGYEMIKRGFYKKAIKLFQLEVHFFPDSYDAYDSLGEAYMEDQQIKKAIQNYTKSLALNPKNTNAEEKLKILQKKL